MSDGRKHERPVLAVTLHSAKFAGAEIVVKGVDELRIEEVCAAICGGKDEFAADEPRVIFVETLRKAAESEGKYIRQTGGRGNYGHVKLRLEPKGEGQGFEFVNEVAHDLLPGEYADAAETGIREAALGGVLFGFEVTDIKATLIDGSFHMGDSNPMAFQIAGAMAFKEAARKANPVLLEPVMAVSVVAPESEIGMICLDINQRRGRIESIEPGQGSVSVTAKIPLREMLRSSKHGSFRYPMQLSQYEPVTNPRGEPGDDVPEVGVRNPRRPTLGHGFAAAELYFESE